MNLVLKEYNEHPLTTSQIEKMGNSFIYLSQNIQPLYKTKALKLLYLIEEISVRKNGIPFFGVDFQMWKLGPVVKDIYIDITAETSLLSSYISKKFEGEDAVAILPNATFNDDEFSDSDMWVLEFVVKTFKDTPTQKLIEITHREGFPWHETAKKSGYLELFEKNLCNATNIVLDLSILLDADQQKKEFYLHTLNYQKESNQLKGNN